jgi:crotonobetainyl-CoA:carnitine CoA-transferase CaiB-like acyl-CoA transferase
LTAGEHYSFFVPIEHPDLGIEVPYPGLPFRLEGWAPPRRPPRLGEHNAEVYRELAGLTRAELAGLAEQGVV